jgi:hypothetical protein
MGMNHDQIMQLTEQLQEHLDQARLLCNNLRCALRDAPEPSAEETNHVISTAPPPPDVTALPADKAADALQDWLQGAKQWAQQNRQFLAPRSVLEQRCADIEELVRRSSVALLQFQDDVRGRYPEQLLP